MVNVQNLGFVYLGFCVSLCVENLYVNYNAAFENRRFHCPEPSAWSVCTIKNVNVQRALSPEILEGVALNSFIPFKKADALLAAACLRGYLYEGKTFQS